MDFRLLGTLKGKKYFFKIIQICMYLDQMLRFQCLYETESSQKDHTKITWHSQTTFRHKSYIESELEKNHTTLS